jgi:hypothetical protein
MFSYTIHDGGLVFQREVFHMFNLFFIDAVDPDQHTGKKGDKQHQGNDRVNAHPNDLFEII